MYAQCADNAAVGYSSQPLLRGGSPPDGLHNGGGAPLYLNVGTPTQQPVNKFSGQKAQNPQQAFPRLTEASLEASRASPALPLTSATRSLPGPPAAEVPTVDSDLESGSTSDDGPRAGESTVPQNKGTWCGIDEVWLRPIGLISWTAISGLLLVFVILPAAAGSVPEAPLRAGRWAFGAAAALTLALELRLRFGDPGVMTEEELAGLQRQRDEEAGEGGVPVPDRAHRCWYHPRPVLRYDHWCRWLHNAIGLRNHRAFFCMVTLLLLSSLCSAIVDLLVLGLLGRGWLAGEPIAEVGVGTLVAAAGHFVVSGGILHFVSDVWKIHVQQISRNELCKESDAGKYEVFPTSKKGSATRREELSSSEEDLDGTEVYAPELNPYDKGWARNWLTFLFASRDSLGEF